MKKILRFLVSLVVKKKQRIFGQEILSKQAREQIKLLRAKGIQLPIITL